MGFNKFFLIASATLTVVSVGYLIYEYATDPNYKFEIWPYCTMAIGVINFFGALRNIKQAEQNKEEGNNKS